ncbi:MAG: coenzyme F420-0:L-glutamate ligase [Anaerolineaceae bacterium]|jgi:coenzyme F420-0:L-glutamate ligase/coenzyme F420-1:gamma-L-glutamate ligase|nr:coenzyme F420-0:L-glutamate ligase [Anaerolineaceae bacterium]
MELLLRALDDVPEVDQKTNLSSLIIEVSTANHWIWEDGDIVVIAQKIVSKSEDRFVNLSDVIPGKRALSYAKHVQKDPRLIELILQESKRVLRTRGGLMIVQHNLGFICANAGIDHSNISIKGRKQEDWVLLLPVDPDLSAKAIQKSLEKHLMKKIGVLIIDSHGRVWREGVVGVSIGISGLPGVVDCRGKRDRNEYELKITQIAVADELAAAASLLMGQAAEGRPIVIAKGFPYNLRESDLSELIRKESEDLFR